MSASDIWVENSQGSLPDNPRNSIFYSGGLFLDTSTIPSSIVNNFSGDVCSFDYPVYSRRNRGEFLCLSLSVKGGNGVISHSAEKRVKIRSSGSRAVNTTKHLWAGAVAAMVSRSILFCSLFIFSNISS